MKISCWHLRSKAVRAAVTGLIIVLIGILLVVKVGSFKPPILSVFGLVSLLVAWFYWKRSKSLVQGRLYFK